MDNVEALETPGVRIRKLPVRAWLIVSALILSLVFALLSAPIITKEVPDRVRLHDRYEQFVIAVRDANDVPGPMFLFPGNQVTLSINPLVDLVLTPGLSSGQQDQEIIQVLETIQLNFEGLVLYLGFSTICLLSVYLLSSQGSTDTVTADSSEQARRHNEHTAESVLRSSVRATETHANSLYKRSTYVLLSGILTSFLGVAVFFSAFPSPDLAFSFPAAESGANNLFLIWSTLRAVGMLFFVEAVAWFLLRQYRLLLEDHKWMTRQFLKRSNYYAAFALSSSSEEQRLAIIASLLAEDHSGVLDRERSTEVLEATKMAEINPVFQLIGAMVEKLPMRKE